jgi:hypothetical protein
MVFLIIIETASLIKRKKNSIVSGGFLHCFYTKAQNISRGHSNGCGEDGPSGPGLEPPLVWGRVVAMFRVG